MLGSLRARLFASYLVLVLVLLGVIAGALVLIFNTRPAPPEATYQRLSALALSINLRDIVRASGFSLMRPTQLDFEALQETLDEIASVRQVRMLLVNINERTVVYDSADLYNEGERFVGEVDSYTFPASIARNVVLPVEAIRGEFIDERGEWLFVGVEGLRQGGARRSTSALLFADPRPVQSLQDALDEFGTELFPILLQAALVGLLIAVVLAAVITRSITRPLQTVAQAAAGMARGNYAERVPVIAAPHEVRAVADAFNLMAAKVQTEQQAQQDFLANVSHDLKTPLTSIQGYSQAIIDGAIPDPLDAARIINGEADRLNRMVIELTDLARLQAGRLSMKMTSIDLGQLTTGVGQRLAIVAKEKGIALTVDAPPMPDIAGDGDRLVQVVTNLISNAIKYTPSGGQVHVATQPDRGGVELTVADTGIGITPEELPRIFERFYQVDKARGPQRGTGLGLAIVQEIIQAHGGRISATSPGEHQGSTFRVWLPSPQMSTVVRRL